MGHPSRVRKVCNVGSLFNVEDAYPHDQNKKKFPTREYPVSKPSAVEYVIPAIRP